MEWNHGEPPVARGFALSVLLRGVGTASGVACDDRPSRLGEDRSAEAVRGDQAFLRL